MEYLLRKSLNLGMDSDKLATQKWMPGIETGNLSRFTDSVLRNLILGLITGRLNSLNFLQEKYQHSFLLHLKRFYCSQRQIHYLPSKPAYDWSLVIAGILDYYITNLPIAWISSDYFESLLLPQLLRGENDSKESDEFQANLPIESCWKVPFINKFLRRWFTIARVSH